MTTNKKCIFCSEEATGTIWIGNRKYWLCDNNDCALQSEREDRHAYECAKDDAEHDEYERYL